MTTVLNLCFGENTRINFEEFSLITEQKTSDMVLSVLSLLRERLPCSENYWRYKRNYEMHMRILAGDQQQQDASGSSSVVMSNADEECKSDGSGAIKKLAKTHMSHVMSLTPYNNSGSRPGSPNGDIPMSPEEVANNIPLQNLKSN